MKKGLMIGGVLLIAIVAVGAYVLLTGLGDIIKVAVEEGGSKVTQVDVSLGKADVSLGDGTASLQGLKVGNPAGFKAPSAFELGAISVKIDTATVTQDPVVINEVVVNAPKITYELGSNGSNIDAIKQNVEKYTGGSSQASSDSGQSGPKVIIENLYVRSGEVNITAAALGGKTMSANLPEIHLKDIGKDSGGAGPGEVAEKVMTALTGKVSGLVSGLDISGIFEGMTNVPDSLKGLAGGAGEKAGEMMKGVTGGAGDAVKGAGDTMKKLFGN